MTVALQKKLLRTRAAEVSRVSTGFIVSLVTNRLPALPDNLLPFLHAPWVSAILIVVAYFLISGIVGYAAAAGLSVLLVSVAIQLDSVSCSRNCEPRRPRLRTAAFD